MSSNKGDHEQTPLLAERVPLGLSQMGEWREGDHPSNAEPPPSFGLPSFLLCDLTCPEPSARRRCGR